MLCEAQSRPYWQANLAAANRRLREIERERAAARATAAIIAQYREIIVLGVKRSARDIIRDTAKQQGVSVDDIVGRSTHKPIVYARHLAIYRVRKERPDMSLPQIGRIFNRDHTTILSAVRKMERQRSKEAA